MTRLLVASLVAFLINFNGFSQIRVGKVVMDYAIESYGEELRMNGADERSALFVEPYSIALYLQEKSSDAIAICYVDETMTIRLVVTSKSIDKKSFTESIVKDFNTATEGNVELLQTRIDKATGLFSESLVNKDVIEFAYEKEIGTHFIKNGKELGLVEGLDFKFALFKIWLGDKPVNDNLKHELLGLD